MKAHVQGEGGGGREGARRPPVTRRSRGGLPGRASAQIWNFQPLKPGNTPRVCGLSHPRGGTWSWWPRETGAHVSRTGVPVSLHPMSSGLGPWQGGGVAAWSPRPSECRLRGGRGHPGEIEPPSA